MRFETFTLEEITAAVEAAIEKAVDETLAGVPIFNHDHNLGINIMKLPDGRKFEIRYIPGALGDRNHEIIRELKAVA
jgi:hypothetical protein